MIEVEVEMMKIILDQEGDEDSSSVTLALSLSLSTSSIGLFPPDGHLAVWRDRQSFDLVLAVIHLQLRFIDRTEFRFCPLSCSSMSYRSDSSNLTDHGLGYPTPFFSTGQMMYYP